MTIVIKEYGDKYPKEYYKFTSAFGWCNFNVFSFVGLTCKVRLHSVPARTVSTCVAAVSTVAD
jgi:hypothetical protein